MGIKGLHQFITKKYPECKSQRHLSHLCFKIVAVDIYTEIYRKLKAQGEKGLYVSMLHFFLLFVRWRVFPIFVFDGPNVPKEKELTRKVRSRNNENLEKRYTQCLEVYSAWNREYQLFDSLDSVPKEILIETESFVGALTSIEETVISMQERVRKLECQTAKVTKEMIGNIQNILSALGLCYIVADGEGEKRCVELVKSDAADYMISSDSDSLCFGTKQLCFSLDKEGYFHFIDREILLESMNFTEKQFIDFCILTSSDYNIGISGIGVDSSFKLITEYGSIEELISSAPLAIRGKSLDAETIEEGTNYTVVRKLFETETCPFPEEASEATYEVNEYLLGCVCRELDINVSIRFVKSTYNNAHLFRD